MFWSSNVKFQAQKFSEKVTQSAVPFYITMCDFVPCTSYNFFKIQDGGHISKRTSLTKYCITLNLCVSEAFCFRQQTFCYQHHHGNSTTGFSPITSSHQLPSYQHKGQATRGRHLPKQPITRRDQFQHLIHENANNWRIDCHAYACTKW